jgi:hypothetical protein
MDASPYVELAFHIADLLLLCCLDALLLVTVTPRWTTASHDLIERSLYPCLNAPQCK